jgi:bifunctional NMN adenylyltransferase/nudix hydrolase
MKKEEEYADVGVIVGRFQVPELTEAHRTLIEMVISRHEKVIIFLGVSGITPVPSTKRNPLDFEMRKQMIENIFQTRVIVSHVRDMKSDEEWSKQLDEKIADLTSPKQSVMLYGGRDSFIRFYHGKHKTEELEPEVYIKMSGTELRQKIKNKVETSAAFRAGVIWANENQYDHAIDVVDIAILNDDCTKILLGRKSYEKEYRFFGGFVDTSRDTSYEMTVRREAQEECGAEITEPVYIMSKMIIDWRYKNETDKVYSSLYAAKYMYGNISPADDIIECRWFDISDSNYDGSLNYPSGTIYKLVDEHKPLFEKLLENLHKLK